MKAGIKRTWTPLGATVLWGEGGQYHDMFNGLCGNPGGVANGGGSLNTNTFCMTFLSRPASLPTMARTLRPRVRHRLEVNRWGAGVMQEIDSAAMHVWFNWQHLELNFDATSACGATSESRSIDVSETCSIGNGKSIKFGQKVNSSFNSLDIFMLGGVIFF